MKLKLSLTFLTLSCLNVINAGVILMDENSIEDEETIDISHLNPGMFGNPDESVGERVKAYNPETDLVNPEELGTYLEGDILNTKPEGRNGLTDVTTRWSGGIVPFEINGGFNANQMALIENAFNEYHAKTCIKFRPRLGEKDYISIENSNSGCWSSVGRTGGRQPVNLQTPGCTTKVGTIVHELMHALGFLHEQNRSERDDFVTIRFNNIQKGTEPNFAKASAATTNAFGVGYDYGSVMHYSATAFSTNGQPTIVAKKSGGSAMGQRNGFSSKDVTKINQMYNCGAVTGQSVSVGSGSTSPVSSGKPSKKPRPSKRPNKVTAGQVAGFISNLIGALHEDNSTATIAP